MRPPTVIGKLYVGIKSQHLIVPRCPFCEHLHTHFAGEPPDPPVLGMRRAGCSKLVIRSYIIAWKGETVDRYPGAPFPAPARGGKRVA